MDDKQANLEREVKELTAEVRRLRRLVETVLVVIGIAVACLWPQLALGVAGLGVMMFFVFLVSPVRKLIFQYIFHDRKFLNRQT